MKKSLEDDTSLSLEEKPFLKEEAGETYQKVVEAYEEAEKAYNADQDEKSMHCFAAWFFFIIC